MCAQSVLALTVRMHDIEIAGAAVTAPWAAAGFDMLSHLTLVDRKQLQRKHKLLVDLAERGAPNSLVPRIVS